MTTPRNITSPSTLNSRRQRHEMLLKKKLSKAAASSCIGMGSTVMLCSAFMFEEKETGIICFLMGSGVVFSGCILNGMSTYYSEQLHPLPLTPELPQLTSVVASSHQQKKQIIPTPFAKARHRQAKKEHKARQQPKSWLTKSKEIISTLATYPRRLIAKYHPATSPTISQVDHKVTDKIKLDEKQKSENNIKFVQPFVKSTPPQHNSSYLPYNRKKSRKKPSPSSSFSPSSSIVISQNNFLRKDKQKGIPSDSLSFPDLSTEFSRASQLTMTVDSFLEVPPTISPRAAIEKVENKPSNLAEKKRSVTPSTSSTPTSTASIFTTTTISQRTATGLSVRQPDTQTKQSSVGLSSLRRQTPINTPIKEKEKKRNPIMSLAPITAPPNVLPMNPLEQKGWVRTLQLGRENKLLKERNRQLKHQIKIEQHRTNYYFNFAHHLMSQPYYFFWPLAPLEPSGVLFTVESSSPPVESRRSLRNSNAGNQP